MALPIRDGNQSLTTLSTILVGNAHIPAHTVISLGSQAITDIATAVSGVELGPNTISALENISVTFGVGTSITIGNVVSVTGGLTNTELRASAVTISGSVTASLPNGSLIGVLDTNGDSILVDVFDGGVQAHVNNSLTIASMPAITGSVSVSNFPAIQSISGSVTVSALPEGIIFGQQLAEGYENYGGLAIQVLPPISGTVTIGNSITISNFPASQTVTFTQAPVTFGQAIVSASNINPLLQSVGTDNTADANLQFVKIGGHQDGSNQISHIVHVSSGGAMKVDATDSSITFGAITGSVSILNLPATQTVTFTQASVTFNSITGYVSVQNFPATQTVTFTQASVTFSATTGSVSVLNFPVTQGISGTVTANLSNVVSSVNGASFLPMLPVGGYDYDNDSTKALNLTSNGEVKVSSLPDISGTVTASISGTPSITFTTAPVTFGGIKIVDTSVTFNVLPAQNGYGTWTSLSVENGTSFLNTVVKNSVTANIGNYSSSVTGYAGGGGSVTAMPVVISDKGIYGGSFLGYNGANTYLNIGIQNVGNTSLSGVSSLPVSGTITVGNSVTIGSMPNISGTVTASISSIPAISGSVTATIVPTTGSPSFLTGTMTATTLTSVVSAGARRYLRIQAMEGGSGSALLFVSFNGTSDHAVLQTSVLQNSATTYPYAFSARSDTLEFSGSWVPQTEIWIRSSSASGKPYSIIYS